MLEWLRTFPSSPTDEQIAYTLKHLTYARIDNWIDTDFSTWGWWVQLGLFIISMVIWWNFVDKERLIELTFYGFSVMTLSIWMDQVGYELGMWYYPVDLIPIFPPSTTFDYVMFPIIYSLIYQYCRTWRSFIIAICIMSGLFSFVLEPLATKLGFYILIEWKYHYSFPIYITMGIVLKMLINKMKLIVASHKERSEK
jgi:hypothetical protein